MYGKHRQVVFRFLMIIFILSDLTAVARSKIKIACVGNSITYGAGMANRENNAYPVQLQNMLGHSYEVKNFGVSGRTLLKKGDYPYWDTKEYTDALNYRADMVFIKLGTNDSKLQNRVHLDEFEVDYKTLISSFRQKDNKVRIILLLPVPSFLEDSTSIWNPVIKEQIIPLIQKVAYDTDSEVIDLYHLMIDQPGLLPDKIHPSSLGASLIARRTYEAVMHKTHKFNLKEKLNPKQAEKLGFYGFDRYDFVYEDLQLKIVLPKRVLSDKPWVWRARFFGHEPQADIALLERGYHIVYCEVGALYGNPEAVQRWNKCYDIMARAGLSRKVVLEGMSRGGLIIYNWAAENPGKVACIYADAPVLDGRSWPGGFGKGKGAADNWKEIKQRYGLASNELPTGFKGWPIYKTDILAKSGIPMLHVCGDADQVVPADENTRPFAKEIKKQGGNIITIYKEGVGHHPHSLENPAPIVDFILRATGHKTNFAAIPTPGAEYRSAAGWAQGKGWWYQARQIDSLCQSYGDIDILFIGNSITQGWGGPRNWVTHRPGQQAAETHFQGLKWIGAGISGDRTQHVAWRLENGHYEHSNPDFVVLTIGVNNFKSANAEEIVVGLEKNLKLLQKKFPKAEILFFGLLPTGLTGTSKRREKYRKIHKALAGLRFVKNVHYNDLENLFTNGDVSLNRDYYSDDGIHLKPEGYKVWAKYIRERIEQL